MSATCRWVVLKFGGTSVSTASRWRCIHSQIQSHLADPNLNVWVTISAMTQVTNKLQKAIQLAVTNRSDPETNESHLDILRHILMQHFILAYEIGLFQSTPSSSDLELETLQEYWMRSVFGSDASIPYPSRSSECIHTQLPTYFHPLLIEFQHLYRVLEGIRLTEEASPRIQARVLSFGELLSTHLGVCILQHLGLQDNVTRVDARELLFSDPSQSKSEEDTYLQAQIPPRTDVSHAIQASQNKRVVLTQGFIASVGSNKRKTCVLGRGGSDTSGSLFAALLNAIKYEIWTDVHGMFTSDPRYVPDARLIRSLDYREAQELAAMGAKVLHPRCIIPVQFAGIPIEIRNTNDPNGATTVIGPSVSSPESASPKILAVVRREEMTTMSINAFYMCGTSGFLSKVFAPFEKHGISVDLIATSQFSVTVTLDHIPGGVGGEPFKQLLCELDTHAKVQVYESCSVVSIVGRHLRKALYELGPVLRVLDGYDVLLLSESAEDLNLSFVLKQSDTKAIVAEMHRYFWEGDRVSESCEMRALRRSSSRDVLFGPSWGMLNGDRVG